MSTKHQKSFAETNRRESKQKKKGRKCAHAQLAERPRKDSSRKAEKKKKRLIAHIYAHPVRQ